MENIKNKVYGNIKVLEDDGGKKVLCLCLLCGRQKMMDRSNIRKKKTIERGGGCGCKRHASGIENARKLADKKNLTGKTIGNVKILKLTGEKKGTNRVYECECLRCGRKFKTTGINITRGDTTSCGCKKDEMTTANLTKDCIDGTKISSLTSGIRRDNTSGIKGISQSKSNGYWQSYINFKGKRYPLYNGPSKEKAVRLRQEAEARLHGDFLKWFRNGQANKGQEN